jgi:hypothetical protein
MSRAGHAQAIDAPIEQAHSRPQSELGTSTPATPLLSEI